MNKRRYIRQILLDKVGEEGQNKLLESHIVIVGCGGLGSVAAPYLAGAGVGRITLVDADIPHISNLHRQVFFGTDEVYKSKAEYLADHIEKLNPDVQLATINEMVQKDTVDRFLSSADIVLECTDHIQTKYLVNDYCHLKEIPMIYGAIHKYEGYLSFFENQSNSSIHLRDVFAEPNEAIPSCSEVGVMGGLAGMIGILQANEAIKYITGAGRVLSNVLLTYNILNNEQLKLRLRKTFMKDMDVIFRDATYKSKETCAPFEISWRTIKSKRDAYCLVSILEDNEHENIDGHVIRNPLSSFEQATIDPTRKVVYYCMSGIRSGKLVNQLLEKGIESLSLKGGLKAVKSQ